MATLIEITTLSATQALVNEDNNVYTAVNLGSGPVYQYTAGTDATTGTITFFFPGKPGFSIGVKGLNAVKINGAIPASVAALATAFNAVFPKANSSSGGSGATSSGADYVITTDGTNITATPKSGSAVTGTDAYTVIQGAINALTPQGTIGTGGGMILIAKGTYTLTNELVINGWENASEPATQLAIIGAGYATSFVQNTNDKNAIVIKNNAGVVLRNLNFTIGANAKSAILMDSNGSYSECSCFDSVVDNIRIYSQSTKAPAAYFKNFFALEVPNLNVYSTSYDGIKLENNSSTIHYGNSKFGLLRSVAPANNSYSAFSIVSTSSARLLNLNQFDSLVLGSVNGYGQSTGRGCYIKGGAHNTFNFVDIEYMPYPIVIDGDNGGIESSSNKFLSGYLYPSNGGIAIQTAYAGANNLFSDLWVEGDNVNIKIFNDLTQFHPTNRYVLTVGATLSKTNYTLTSPKTSVEIRQNGSDVTYLKLPSATLDNNGVFDGPIGIGISPSVGAVHVKGGPSFASAPANSVAIGAITGTVSGHSSGQGIMMAGSADGNHGYMNYDGSVINFGQVASAAHLAIMQLSPYYVQIPSQVVTPYLVAGNLYGGHSASGTLFLSATDSATKGTINMGGVFYVDEAKSIVRLPNMTKTTRNAISSPPVGAMIFQTDNTPGVRVYNGTNWMRYTETAD